VAQQVEYMWEPLMAALGKEPEAEVLAALLESLAEMVEMLEQGLLQQAMVQRLFDQLKVRGAAGGRLALLLPPLSSALLGCGQGRAWHPKSFLSVLGMHLEAVS
jgi:hypothetical protein